MTATDLDHRLNRRKLMRQLKQSVEGSPYQKRRAEELAAARRRFEQGICCE